MGCSEGSTARSIWVRGGESRVFCVFQRMEPSMMERWGKMRTVPRGFCSMPSRRKSERFAAFPGRGRGDSAVAAPRSEKVGRFFWMLVTAVSSRRR